MLTHLLRPALGHTLKPFIFEKNQGFASELNVPRLGIYVHIPFCESLCPFCPYFKVVYDKKQIDPFVKALLTEIRLAAESYTKQTNGEKKSITSVYFGGGTPSLIREYLPEIMQAIQAGFHIAGEVGIELHPAHVTTELLGFLKAQRFTMLSLGVQSFVEKNLQTLGRQNNKQQLEALRMAQVAGFRAIDVDLIFGIPGQSAGELAEDFSLAARNGATQISTYPFIDFTFAHNKSKPVDHKQKRVLLNSLIDTAGSEGFIRNTVWTFKRKGSPSYSSVTRDNFIGFGPSATSLGKTTFKINTFSVTEYIRVLNKGALPTSLVLRFTPRARELYWLFWRCYNLDLNQADFKDLFDHELAERFKGSFLAGRWFGLLKKNRQSGEWELTKRGAYAFHVVEQIYTRQYIDKTWRIAHQESWPEKILLY